MSLTTPDAKFEVVLTQYEDGRIEWQAQAFGVRLRAVDQVLQARRVMLHAIAALTITNRPAPRSLLPT